MKTIQKTVSRRLQYPASAYRFLFSALRYTQERLGRAQAPDNNNERAAHITGQELACGIRDYARNEFGLMALTVFRCWGVHGTDDFGKMVFELIERGEMRKSPHDRLSDFHDVYDFEEAFGRSYRIDVRHAFRQ